MVSLLLPIIYLTFVSLGLPDGLLGAAWPAMHVDLGAPIAAQSAISIIISCGTTASSLMTDRLVRRLGTGRLCALSVALTAAAILGFSATQELWQLCLIAVPYGLGAGAIDAALNNYVALHYGARHMSWLHCSWGIGASVGPVVMGWALADPLGWHGGYLAIGVVQAAITLLLFATLGLWKQDVAANGQADDANDALPNGHDTSKRLTNRELLRLPGAKTSIGSFGCYCAFESSAGLWIASYLAMARGVDTATAASMASLFYVGITAGRLVSGFVANRLTSEQQIRIGQVCIVAGLAVLLIAPVEALLWVALGLIGFGCAPIYPSIVALTPKRFGTQASQGLVSLQMACAYAANAAVPPVFGLVAGSGGAVAIPLMLVALLAANILLCERTAAQTRR